MSAKMTKRVLVFGVWDMFHVGHLRFLEEAKKRFGPAHVYVGVVPDALVTKGQGRPVIPQQERIEILDALWQTDTVLLSGQADAMDIIRIIKPDIYLKGEDYKPYNNGNPYYNVFCEEAALVSGFGGKVEYSVLDRTQSTTGIIERVSELAKCT